MFGDSENARAFTNADNLTRKRSACEPADSRSPKQMRTYFQDQTIKLFERQLSEVDDSLSVANNNANAAQQVSANAQAYGSAPHADRAYV